MTDPTPADTPTPDTDTDTPGARRRRPAVFLLPLAVVVLGAGVCILLVVTAPEIEEEDDVRPPKVVKTSHVEPSDERIAVTELFGTVIPVRQLVVKPQVQGRVIRQHVALEPGGFIEAGEELVAIDPSDYELALVAQQTALEEALFELEVERGRQVVASREWRLLQGDVPREDANRSLVLREPHLRRAEALVRKARNGIARAQLDLERTSLTAPYNSVVLEESVEVGQLLETGTRVATLAGADEFWVRVSVPIDMLRWIELPGDDRPGASARVILDAGKDRRVTRQGHVDRLLGDLEPSGRMARVLVSVKNPLGRKEGTTDVPLLLGSYVEVEIDAGVLREVLSIQRAALREGNRIWLADADDRLQVRQIEILWSRRDSVLIPKHSIQPGERLIVSGLRLALPGMRLNPQAQADADSADQISRRPEEP